MQAACHLRLLCYPLEGNPSGLRFHEVQISDHSRGKVTLVREDSYENDAQASVGDKRKRQETLENYMLLDMKVSEQP